MKHEWRLEGVLSLGSTLALRKPGAKGPKQARRGRPVSSVPGTGTNVLS